MSGSIDAHYDAIASNYDQLYDFRTERFADIALKYLKVRSDDKIADIGGGTGSVAEIIRKKCPDLQSDILIVDPSSASINIAQKKEGLSVMLADFDQFLASPQCSSYNKYFLCTSACHIPDQKETYKVAYEHLPPGGEILVINAGRKKGDKETLFPLWKNAYTKLRSVINTIHINTYECLKNVGFVVVTEESSHTIRLTKEEYFGKIRGRVFSLLRFFNDDEIEAGIKELNETLLFGKDIVEIDDLLWIFHGIKQ